MSFLLPIAAGLAPTIIDWVSDWWGDLTGDNDEESYDDEEVYYY